MRKTRTSVRSPRQTLALADELAPLQRPAMPARTLNQLKGALAQQGPGVWKGAAFETWARAQTGAAGAWARQLVLARIEWDRSLGRPQALPLAEAFAAVHWRWQDIKMFTPGGGVRWISLSSPVLPGPVLGEGPHDDVRWRVSVLLLPTSNAKQALELGFAPAAGWKAPSGRPVRVALRPALRYFGPAEGPQSLPVFVVRAAP